MDLISHVPGVGPTASFTPGPNTSAPLNVAHTGMTNGVDPDTSSRNMAEIYNRLMLQVASVIVKSGLTVDNANWAQLGTAVQTIASGSVQSLGISGQTLSISGGNSVTLPDNDQQTLGLSGQTLSISGGNSVTLPDSNPAGGYGGYAVTHGYLPFSPIPPTPATGMWVVPGLNTFLGGTPLTLNVASIARHPQISNLWYSSMLADWVRLNTGVWVATTIVAGPIKQIVVPAGTYIVQLALNGIDPTAIGDPVSVGGVGE